MIVINNSLILSSALILLPCSCYAYISIIKLNAYGQDLSALDYIHSNILHFIFIIWIWIEVLFYTYFVQRRLALQKTTKPKKPLNENERKALFWNCVHTIRDIKTWCTGWYYYKKTFKHPKFHEIRKDNLAIWFAWAFWNEHLEIVRENEAWAKEIEWMIFSAETYFHIKFAEGYNQDLQCIRLNLDPVHAVHRPFIVYLGLYLITKCYNLIYLHMWAGFTHSTTANAIASDILWGGPFQKIDTAVNLISSALLGSANNSATKNNKNASPTGTATAPALLSYWYREALTVENNTLTPIVFIHGIGVGVICYTEFIHQIAKIDRPIFLVEVPYVSMHMVDNVPTAAETVLEITQMLEYHQYDKAVYVGHSVGTAVCSWVMKNASDTVGGMVLIDPICFLLHYHNVAFNFVYRIPKTFFEQVMHYGAARELYISNYISRHFQWFEAIYFTQPNNSSDKLKLPASLDTSSPLSNATVFLSERDGLVCSAYVYQYLLERGVDAYIMKELEHAMFLTNTNWKNTIKKQIDTIALRADSRSTVSNPAPVVTSLK